MPSVCSKPVPSSFGQQVWNVTAEFNVIRIFFSGCEALQECATDLCHFALPMEAFEELACDFRDCISDLKGGGVFVPCTSRTHGQIPRQGQSTTDVVRMDDVAALCVTSWLAFHAAAPTGMDMSMSTSPPTIATAGVAHVEERDAQLGEDEASAQARADLVAAYLPQQEQPAAVAAGRSPEHTSLLAAFFPGYFPESVLLKICYAQAGIFAATIIANSLSMGAWTLMPSACCLYHLGASWGPAIAAGGIIRLVTPIFLHASLSHLFLNTVFQCRMGFNVERELGSSKFACLYLLSGVFGNVFSAAFEPWKLAVGASTSALGLMGANAVLQVINWHSLAPQTRLRNLCVFAVIGSAFAFSATAGTDACGHLGGFLAGVCLSTLLVDRVYVARSPLADKWPRAKLGAMVVLGGLVGWSAGTLFVLPIDPSEATNIESWCPYSWDWALHALGRDAQSIA